MSEIVRQCCPVCSGEDPTCAVCLGTDDSRVVHAVADAKELSRVRSQLEFREDAIKMLSAQVKDLSAEVERVRIKGKDLLDVVELLEGGDPAVSALLCSIVALLEAPLTKHLTSNEALSVRELCIRASACFGGEITQERLAVGMAHAACALAKLKQREDL